MQPCCVLQNKFIYIKNIKFNRSEKASLSKFCLRLKPNATQEITDEEAREEEYRRMEEV